MTSLTTVVGFLLFTGILMRIYMRRALVDEHAASAKLRARNCPRCSHAVPEGEGSCPQCHVPIGAFDLVAAQEATSVSSDDTHEGLHAVVRRDVCIGCGACVPACPEAGAIRLERNVAVVDKSLCLGHGACAAACPVGGIALSRGAAVQRVEVPAVDIRFESNVPGLYIVGELGGRALIKNAINEGKIAIEAIVAGGPLADDPDIVDVAIVGAGPAGISAGLAAIEHGLRYALFERGTAADTIRKYPRHKILFAEPVRVPVYGDLWITDGSKETLLQVWETIIASTGLRIRSHEEVLGIEREGEAFLVRTAKKHVRARQVVLALGRRGNPRRLGVPGEDSAHVFYDMPEVAEFRASSVLVVGGGDSAIESAIALANQERTTVYLAHRTESFTKAKARNRDKLDAALQRGSIRLLCPARIVAIRQERVELVVGDASRVVAVDYVLVRIGGEPPSAFLERMGVRMVTKEVPLLEGAT